MKINKLFHWLYAFLMGLPLLSSLWIGLIWTFNENAQVPTITENVSREVDFNQLVKDNYGNFVISSTGDYQVNLTYNNNELKNHYILVKTNFPSNVQFWTMDSIAPNTWVLPNQDAVNRSSYINTRYQMVQSHYFLRIQPFDLSNYVGQSFILQIFDLTQMFGYGNEPSTSEFNIWYPDIYYNYTESRHEVIENYSTKQVLDSPLNYIWLPSFGGMGWTIQNVFNSMVNGMFGLATSYGIGLTIVKLLTYWLCISLIWLIYDVIMYVPLMIHRWLDKGVIS